MFTLLLLFAMLVAINAFSVSSTRAYVNARGDTEVKMSVELADLPYDYTALEPHIGEQTLKIHHDKHHAKVCVS